MKEERKLELAGSRTEIVARKTRVEGRTIVEKQSQGEEKRQGAMTEQTRLIQVDELEQPATKEGCEEMRVPSPKLSTRTKSDWGSIGTWNS